MPQGENPKLTEPWPSPALLAHYRKRIEDFEVERDDLLKRISSCTAPAAESHTLRCEVQRRADEVRELQNALSAAHVHLFEERDRLLRLQAENDELRLQQVEDRRRLQHLLAITQPVDQEVTFARNEGPSSGTQHPRKGLKGRGNVDNKPTRDRSVREGGDGQRVLRTVYLPSANADALQLKVESLQAQLSEQRQLAAERVEALMQDRKLREQDEEAHRVNFQRQITDLTSKLKRTEEALRSATKDYILARRDKQAAETERATVEAALAQERKAAADKLSSLKATLEDKLAKCKASGDSALAAETSRLTKLLKTREAEVSQIESMHSAVKAQLEDRVAELETKLAKTKEKLKQVEYRRVLDTEGFTNDVTLLRKQLASVDRKLHAMRLASRVDDDERLHAMLTKLQKQLPDSDIVHPDGGPQTKGAVDELKGIKGNLLGLEKRLRKQVLSPSRAMNT